MRKNTLTFAFALLLLICTICALTACDKEECNHKWEKATCTRPKSCIKCGAIRGAVLEHDWTEASCTTPKTCKMCSQTSGTELGHTWTEATCTTAKTCNTCNEISGTELGHIWTEATCTTAKTCKTCNEVSGKALGHNYVKKVFLEPTCEHKGRAEFKCSVCRNYFIGDISLPSYHDFNDFSDLVLKSVGEITAHQNGGNNSGTCFVISSDGQIVTSLRLLENAYSATVSLQGESYNVEQILAYDKSIDLAVLKINAQDLQPLSICEKNHPNGMTVYTVQKEGRNTHSVVSKIYGANYIVDGVEYVDHYAEILTNGTGGPLINIYGEVIGINIFESEESHDFLGGYTISVSELSKLHYGIPITISQLNEE